MAAFGEGLRMERCERVRVGGEVVVRRVGREGGAEGGAAAAGGWCQGRMVQRTSQGRIHTAARCRVSMKGEVVVDQRAVLAVKMVQRHCIDTGTDTSGKPVSEDPMRELRVMQHLSEASSHPGAEHIARLHHVWYDDEWVYAFMDYGEGGDLFDAVGQTRAAGAERADLCRSYMAQLLRGLDFLRTKGVAHRDLSLENVVLRRGRLMIIDFGLAVVAKPGVVSRRDGSGIGKLLMTAPEVFKEGDYDPFSADMWSLGVMMFMTLTGHHPYTSVDPRKCRFMRDILRGGKSKLAAHLADAWGPDAAHLCFALMTPDVPRPTPRACLGHPFLAGVAPPPVGRRAPLAKEVTSPSPDESARGGSPVSDSSSGAEEKKGEEADMMDLTSPLPTPVAVPRIKAPPVGPLAAEAEAAAAETPGGESAMDLTSPPVTASMGPPPPKLHGLGSTTAPATPLAEDAMELSSPPQEPSSGPALPQFESLAPPRLSINVPLGGRP